ncbi:23S rRNA (adenine(2030)-N(6))-methyltransferase RlmJ [Thiomicrorhabdus sediminis]|uniref:Ribosomal RNA large subunit methyltransferase J n=1 Tax=Thiomicrorhabdus sediminis TaxID=2580412 RepID=A0A4P9K4J8_9GAMM|nr:23S rRNA (adenine(2030)-N(6))-methyltransferase RlmJ [Thiomicrorhabdus sediminis]QCU89838.1 23S rRNA (adenine(2030)-N(6))-methyltransferase RlmJ [Thiomicrorhabdus sediminis]
MLSYLHSFHAGNFADVLKHSISAYILDYLTSKPKPMFYLDTHSGVGAFSLFASEAQKNKEYQNGIGKLWHLSQDRNAFEQAPELVQQYLELIQQFNNSDELSHYPGSPWFAQHLLREHDRLNLFELHPREFKTLSQNFANDRRIKVFQKDGFHGCNSQLPPKERRGYILMDPPYEVKTDYQTALDAFIKAHKKFSTGTYALWYPVVNRKQIDLLEQQFKDSGVKNIQLFELGIGKDEDKGMNSSGMIVINPPWTLMKAAQQALPWLSTQLAGKEGFYRCEQLVEE